MDVYVGVDVGSSYVHAVVLNSNRSIVYAVRPVQHFANPLGAVLEVWQDITSIFHESSIVSTSFTGSGAKGFEAAMPGVIYVYDSVAIPAGIGVVHPEAELVFHMGAKDAYYFNLTRVNNQPTIQDWRTGTKCGGGSGTLIEKQCRRLFDGQTQPATLTHIQATDDPIHRECARIANRRKLQERMETMYSHAQAEASLSKDPSEFLARCGVVVQSDLIHKQNEGASRRDNLAGLFRTVARNYKIDVLGAETFEPSEQPCHALATGGVMASDLIVSHLQAMLGIRIDRPAQFQHMAAIGTAAKAIELGNRFVFNLKQLKATAEHSRKNRLFAPPLSESLALVHEQTQPLEKTLKPGQQVIIGIDGGSTTTKGALVDLKTGRLLDKLYVKTHGDPEASLKHVLAYLGRHKDTVKVCGVGATGSARKLYEKILINQALSESLTADGKVCVDRITDEITCHALGVKHFDPDTDTIFEIGGQDMKFTRFADDGTVKEAKMNYSCQAGSGQTLENMADIINLKVESTLQDAALRAKRVPVIDSTCGVFMEMDENRLIAEGFDTDEIAAAIICGTAASYFYKFVGGQQHVGKKCSAQGGPPLGKAFLAALAQVTGREVEAYAHREMFGAWGQALDIIEFIRQQESQGHHCDTAFRGWDLIHQTFDKQTVLCHDLYDGKSCGVRNCLLDVFRIDQDEIISGGFCPRGNTENGQTPKTNYVDLYHSLYDKHFKKQGVRLEDLTEDVLRQHANARSIGIKRSTATLGEKGIWSAALLKAIGFLPVMSPRSNAEIAQMGVECSRTEFCIARKLATGHAAVLNEHPRVSFLFNPSFIEQRNLDPTSGPDLKYCIYTESEGYVLNDVLSLDKSRQINPILHFGDTPLLIEQWQVEFKRVGLNVSVKALKLAIEAADQAERAFKVDLHEQGDRFLARVEKQGTEAYVGLGRDYVLLDPEASANSGHLFSQVRGLDYIPQVFLEHRFADVNLDEFVHNEFWVQSVKILKANVYVARHSKLYGIRLINFACGPDSLKIYQERNIHEAAHKPLLVLVTDGQTNNAPFVTRTEAHERVVSQSQSRPLDISLLKHTTANHHAQRTWLIPFMGNASVLSAAALRHFGVKAKVLPTNTPLGNELARKHISTEVCHPLKGVVGDALGYLRNCVDKRGLAQVCDNYLVMLPTTSGPCRFGKYTELVREFMGKEGLGAIPVAGPSSKSDYMDVPFPKRMGLSDKMAFQKLLFRGIRAADLLEDCVLRFRPYAKDKADAARVHQGSLDALETIIEDGGRTRDLVQWGHDTVTQFKALACTHGQRHPLVLYIGEIYMRQHDPYTGYVIEHLENTGLELVRDPVSEWLHYINRLTIRKTRRDMRLGFKHRDWSRAWTQAGHFGKSSLKGLYMTQVDAQIEAPFHEVLAGRHILPKPIDMIETLEKAHEIHGNIEGESPLSTSIAYHIMHDLAQPGENSPICGIFHLGPFTCMQESVATAKIEAMVKEHKKKNPDLVFPIIHAFFGDSPNTNLDSEIAVFREQCYQKRDM